MSTPVAAIPGQLSRWALPIGPTALVRNAYSLILSAMVSSGLGLAYWVLAARLFPAAEVGRDSALISCLVALSSVAQLNLAVALPRLLPASRDQARGLVLAAYGTSMVLGLLIGTAFVLVVPHLVPRLSFLNGRTGVVFVLATGMWGVFSLQDSVLTGMRRTIWVPVDNAVFGVVKIAAAVGLAALVVRRGIFYSWTLAALIPLVPVNLLIFRRVLPGGTGAAPQALIRELRAGGFLRYLQLDYAASLLKLAYVGFVPLFVVARLGAETNAYFFIGFTIALAVDTIAMALGTSLTVEAAHDERALAPLARHALRRVMLLGGTSAAFVVLFAPVVLRPFGTSYSEHGSAVLQLLACATVPRAVLHIWSAVARVQRRGGAVLELQTSVLVLGVGLSFALVGPLGAPGVALAWLLAHLLVALSVLPRLVRAVGVAPSGRHDRRAVPALATAGVAAFAPTAPLVSLSAPEPALPQARPSRPAVPLSRPGLPSLPHLGALLLVVLATVGVAPVPAGARALAVLLVMVLAPGFAAVALLQPSSAPARAGMALAAGLSTWILLATLMASVRLWHPTLVYGAVLVLSLAVLLTKGRTAPRYLPPPVRVLRPGRVALVHLATLAGALVLWGLALGQVHVPAGSTTGILPSLPWMFWVAVALLDLGFCLEVCTRMRGPLLAAYTTALVLVVQGLPAIVYAVPRYPWTYKHLGVSGYIAAHGALDRSADIFQNWPGLFATGAVLAVVSGASLLAVAGWSEVVFSLFDAVALVFVLNELTGGRRRVVWLATWLFLACNWVGQDYYSPQAVSYVLVLLAVGLVLRTLPGHRHVSMTTRALRQRILHPRASRQRPSVGDPVSIALPTAGPVSVFARRGGELLTYAAFAAVAVTHQLSPLMLTGVVVAFAAFGIAGRWRTVAIVLACTAGWYYLARDYLAGQPSLLNISLKPLANSTSSVTPVHGAPDGLLISHVAMAISLSAFALASLGVLRRWRAGRVDLAAMTLAAIPLLLIVGYSYGGEAIYRVYLFSLPGLVVLGARALLPRDDEAETPRVRKRTVAATLAITATFVAGLVVVGYGREQINHVRLGEVQAAQYFYDNAPAGSLLVSAAPTFPLRLSPNYVSYGERGRYTDPDLQQIDALRGHQLTDADVALIATLYPRAFPHASNVYLALSTTMGSFVDTYGGMKAGSVERLDALLSTSTRFQQVFRNRDAVLYRLVR